MLCHWRGHWRWPQVGEDDNAFMNQALSLGWETGTSRGGGSPSGWDLSTVLFECSTAEIFADGSHSKEEPCMRVTRRCQWLLPCYNPNQVAPGQQREEIDELAAAHPGFPHMGASASKIPHLWPVGDLGFCKGYVLLRFECCALKTRYRKAPTLPKGKLSVKSMGSWKNTTYFGTNVGRSNGWCTCGKTV